MIMKHQGLQKYLITVLIFPSSYQKLVTTASPTQTSQEGNQKDLLLLVSSNDNKTSRFAPKSLLDATIKLLPSPPPWKKIYPPQLSIAIGKWSFRKIPSNKEYLTSEGKKSIVLWRKFRFERTIQRVAYINYSIIKGPLSATWLEKWNVQEYHVIVTISPSYLDKHP